MRETEAVFKAVAAAARERRGVVLATIVRARGSTPRGVGSRMLIDPKRGLVGTVGGGCGEAQVIESAHEVLQTGASRVITIDLTDDLLGWSPAVCGGVFDVLLEPLSSRSLDG
jgi:xanthine/CO dehydrogenase XdhC/CoxF family maturation factor